MPAITFPSAIPRAAATAPAFSLVLGGPLFQVFRRTRLTDETLGLVRRRIGVVVAVAWAPLVLLAALHGRLVGAASEVSFLRDVGFQLRFLVVTPLLILAEWVVHLRLRPIVDQFRIRALVAPGQAGRFEQAFERAMRWRNSALAEAALLVVVYAAGGLFSLRHYIRLGDAGGWYAAASGGLSAAGLWLVFVSLPLLQFLLLRWYYRLFIWAMFLGRVSRLDLDLDATHPDRAGGLGFLSESLIAFVPIAAAHGFLFAGMIADRILFAGASLTEFQMEVFVGAVFLVLVFAGPLALFGPQLARVKRAGLRDYGALGQTYVRDFRRKWLAGTPADEALLGSGDIQSLADFGNSFSVVEQMRVAPIRPTAVIYFVAAFLGPMLPLLLTMMPAEKLIARLVGLVF